MENHSHLTLFILFPPPTPPTPCLGVGPPGLCQASAPPLPPSHVVPLSPVPPPSPLSPWDHYHLPQGPENKSFECG